MGCLEIQCHIIYQEIQKTASIQPTASKPEAPLVGIVGDRFEGLYSGLIHQILGIEPDTFALEFNLLHHD